MKLYDGGSSPNPFTVRLFVAERGGLSLDIERVDLARLENRGAAFRAINPFGTLPALALDDGTVLSDIVAVCEYLDETAAGGDSLVGSDPRQRALTRMWSRRVDAGIAQRFTSWWRGSDDALDFYAGHRIPETGGRAENRRIAEANLILLDQRLQSECRDFIVGPRPMLPDILLFAFVHTMKGAVPWLLPAARPAVAGWYDRMLDRPAVALAVAEVAHISG